MQGMGDNYIMAKVRTALPNNHLAHPDIHVHVSIITTCIILPNIAYVLYMHYCESRSMHVTDVM